MTGKGHLASGTAIAADALLAGRFLLDSGASGAAARLPGAFIGFTMARQDSWLAFAAGIGMFLAGYYIGLLLPDIDKQNSTIAKKLHICLAVNHRGITHSVWALVIVFSAGFLVPAAAPLFRGTFLGMLVHDLADAPSQAGWVPLYPLGRWRVYNGTVMTRRRGHIVLYSSSRPGSEAVANGMLIVLSACGMGFWAYMAYWLK